MQEYFNFYKEKKKLQKNIVTPSMISHLAITSKTIYDKKPCYNIFSWQEYDYFIDNWRLHVVNEKERLDIISKKYYNSVGYWWVIVLFNADISLDPYELEKPGVELKIPELRDIIDFIDIFRK